MGSDKLFHKHKIRRDKTLSRQKAKKSPYETLLIVCEDSKSAPNYFKEFIKHHRINSANVRIVPSQGAAPISVVEYAIDIAKNTAGIDLVYCVIDRDAHESYERAINKLNNHNHKRNDKSKPIYTAITSTPCFEIWLLLHFQYSTKAYGIAGNKSANSFALLKAIGHDCAGAISCHEMDEPIIAQRSVPLTGKMIDDNELYHHIKDLPQKPLFMDAEGLRLSLAGVQDKAAVCLIDKQITLPENNCPTTHILKPASSRFADIAENEYFILKLAKRIGLPVAEVELRKIKDITFLLVERFDRRIKNNAIERIHQEDFCQALSTLSNKKYQNEGGPGLKNCFDLLNTTTLPAVDRNTLASAIVFNYLIGNMDAHGKIFSLLHHTAENIRLAPFYDMVCTRVYRDLSDKMAMKIGSKYHADDVLPRHWQQLCEASNYRYIAMIRLIEKIADELMKAAVEEKEQLRADGILSPIIDKIISLMNIHIERTLKRFEDG